MGWKRSDGGAERGKNLYIFNFLSSSNILENKGNYDYFPIFKIFTKSKIRCSSLVAHKSTSFGANCSFVSLQLYSWRRFLCTIIFDRSQQNMTSLCRHLRPAHPPKYLWSGWAKLMKEAAYKIWWQYLLSFLSHRKISRGGRLALPHRGAGQVNNYSMFNGHWPL